MAIHFIQVDDCNLNSKLALQEVGKRRRWDVTEDDTGHLYFYTAEGDSVWELPINDHSDSAGVKQLCM